MLQRSVLTIARVGGSGPFSWRGDETQAGSDVEEDDPLGGRADRLGDRAVIRVVEIGITRLQRGKGDDEAVVVAVLQPFGLVECPSTTASTPGIVPRKPRTNGRTSSSVWICFPLFQDTRTTWLIEVTARRYASAPASSRGGRCAGGRISRQ
jgi:hypothetical protein